MSKNPKWTETDRLAILLNICLTVYSQFMDYHVPIRLSRVLICDICNDVIYHVSSATLCSSPYTASE